MNEENDPTPDRSRRYYYLSWVAFLGAFPLAFALASGASDSVGASLCLLFVGVGGSVVSAACVSYTTHQYKSESELCGIIAWSPWLLLGIVILLLVSSVGDALLG